MNIDSKNTERGEPVLGVVGSFSAEARSRLGAHPTSDTLLAYHDRQLGDADAEGIREHLALCGGCIQRALDLEPLCRRAVSKGRARSSTKAAEAWQSTRRALVWQGLPRAAPAKAEPAAWRSLLGPRLAYASAAIFLLTTVGLSLRLVDTDRALSELRQPRANVVLADLYPLADGGLRAGQSERLPVATETDDDLVLILHLLDPGSYTGYRAEAVRLPLSEDLSGPPPAAATQGREDPVVWSTDTLERSPEGDFTVLLPRRLLATGRYLIRLYGMRGERPEALAEYVLLFALPQAE